MLITVRTMSVTEIMTYIFRFQYGEKITFQASVLYILLIFHKHFAECDLKLYLGTFI